MGREDHCPCVARRPPDEVISSRIPRLETSPAYTRLKLPTSFDSSSEQMLGHLLLDRLERVMPETEDHISMNYLEDASLLLSLRRSMQGIAASGNRRLIPAFDAVLHGPLSREETEDLRGMLAAEKEAALGGSGVSGKAQRLKGAYHLVNAAAIRQRRPGPASTA